MQMSRKTVGIIALILAIIMLIPAIAFAKPVWFTKSQVMLPTISETDYNDIIVAKVFGDKSTGKILNKNHELTGVNADYKELWICFDSHKMLPFEISLSDIILNNIPEKYKDRVVAKLNTPINGREISYEQAEISFILYTADMSNEEINEMVAQMEVCVKWNFTPGISGADYIVLGQ